MCSPLPFTLFQTTSGCFFLLTQVVRVVSRRSAGARAPGGSEVHGHGWGGSAHQVGDCTRSTEPGEGRQVLLWAGRARWPLGILNSASCQERGEKVEDPGPVLRSSAQMRYRHHRVAVTSRSCGGSREERAKDKARERGVVKRNGQRPGREWTGEGGERHAVGQPHPMATSSLLKGPL